MTGFDHHPPKIAIVHDALCTSGGAEKLVLDMLKVFPTADLYTSVYLPNKTHAGFKSYEVHTLPLSKIIKSEKAFKLTYPVWLAAIKKLDLRRYAHVLSSSTYLAKFLSPQLTPQHKCYLHAPFRLLWKTQSYSSDSLPTPALMNDWIMRNIHRLQRWDYQATQFIPAIASNSKNMRNEIQRVYNRASTVIYPSVDTNDFQPAATRGDYYLTVSRLISHKRVDLAIQACNQLHKTLYVVGAGPELGSLQRLAGPTITFLGRLSDANLLAAYQNAKALIFPSQEDFGIAPLEAQACGTPVIAYGAGGALETVVEGQSGLFFEEQSAGSIISAIERFENSAWSPQVVRQQATKFSFETFRQTLQQFVLGSQA